MRQYSIMENNTVNTSGANEQPVETDVTPGLYMQAFQNSDVQTSEKSVSSVPSAPVKKKFCFYAIGGGNVVPVKPSRPFPFTFVISILICSFLLMFFIMNKIALDDCKKDIADIKSEIAKLEEDKDVLQTKLSQKEDITYIKEYAEEKLGMVPQDNVTTVTVEVIEEDKTEITKYDDEIDGWDFMLFSATHVFEHFFGNEE